MDNNNNDPDSRPDRLDEADLEIQKRLETVITRLGETPSNQNNQDQQPQSIQQYIQQLTKYLDDLSQILELDLEDHKAFILRILTLCAYQLPQKCCIYTTLVGLINAKDFSIGNEFLDLLIKELDILLKQERWDEARYMIRFICDLVNANVVSTESVIMFLETLLDVVQEENIPFVRKDWYSFAILSALPWCGKELYDKEDARSHLDEIVLCIEQYLKSQERMVHAQTVKQILCVWKNDNPHPQEEFLAVLLEQIHTMQNNSWQERFLIRPYLSFREKLEEALLHDIPPFEPPVHCASAEYPTPKVVFRMFDLTDVSDCDNQNLPPPKQIERFIIEEQIVQTLEIYQKDKKMVAERLLNMPGGTRIPIQAMVVEVLFAQMLNLPHASSEITAMYTCIFIELCKLQPVKIPPVISNACETIYSRLESMSLKSREKFEDWFAHHLSNFQFLWGWDNWTGENLNEDLSNSHGVLFVKEIFENCLRLSYFSKLADQVPEEIQHLLPKEPICKFKFKRRVPIPAPKEDSESEMGSPRAEKEQDPIDLDEGLASRRDWAKKLVENLKTRRSAQEIIEFLNQIERSGLGPDGNATEEGCHWEAIDVFVTTILEYRKRSLSHTTSALNSYLPVFLHLAKTETGKNLILWTLFEVWRDHKQMVIVVIDRMLSCCVITPSSVLNWALSREMSQELPRAWVWKAVSNTVKKMNKHVNKISYELDDIRDRCENPDTNQLDSEMNEDNMLNIHAAFAPDEIEVSKAERKFEAAKEQQKRLFMQLFQRIVVLVSYQMSVCKKAQDAGDKLATNNGLLLLEIYYERLRGLLLRYNVNIVQHTQVLQKTVFDDADDNSQLIFRRFQQLTA